MSCSMSTAAAQCIGPPDRDGTVRPHNQAVAIPGRRQGAGRGQSARYLPPTERMLADAHLIAAAPELYAALCAARDRLAATRSDTGWEAPPVPSHS